MIWRKWKHGIFKMLTTICGSLLLVYPVNILLTHVKQRAIPTSNLTIHYNESLLITTTSTEAINVTREVVKHPRVEIHGGSFCVVPNFIQPPRPPNLKNTITYASYGTLHFFKYLRMIGERWDGPISFSLYMVDMEVESLGKTWRYVQGMIGCDPNLAQKLYVHILFPSGLSGLCSRKALANPKLWKGSKTDGKGVCPKDIDEAESARIRDFHGISYPYNANRNVARTHAPTDLVLVADSELVPCKDFVRLFMNFYAQAESEKAVVWVVPVFEIDAESSFPASKSDLVELYKTNAAVPFHHNYFGSAHIIPDLDKWIARKHDPLNATLHSPAKYLGNQWEPTCIMRKDVPAYDERFIGFGKCKASQTLELCCADYAFYVMDGIFLTHSGIKFEGVRSPAAYAALKINSIYLSTQFWTKMKNQYSCETVHWCFKRCNCTMEIPPLQ